MLPDDLRKFREGLFHTKVEFAGVLERLRGIPVPWRTIEEWEYDRPGRNKPIPIYPVEIEAIKREVAPRAHHCGCGRLAIVRKNETDLCAECATPRNWFKSKQLAIVS